MKKLAIALLLVTTACVSMKNSSISPIQDKSGKKIGTANISVESAYDQGSTMTVMTSDGELFKGEVVRDSVESEYADDMLAFSGTASRYSSRGYSMLIGSNGNSMECTLRLTRPSRNIAWGGGGECKISDGRVIPVNLSSSNKRQ